MCEEGTQNVMNWKPTPQSKKVCSLLLDAVFAYILKIWSTSEKKKKKNKKHNFLFCNRAALCKHPAGQEIHLF